VHASKISLVRSTMSGIAGSKQNRKRKQELDQNNHRNHPPLINNASSSTVRSVAQPASSMPSSISSSRPQWAPSNSSFPWSSQAAIYGNCQNVSSYEKIGRVGEGTYGVVYQARDKKTGEIVALKRCLPHHEASDGFPLTTFREITILKELQNEGGPEHGIIGLKDVTVSSSRSGVFLVFEYAQHDLASLLDNHYTQHNSSPFSHSEVKRLMLQLLEALRFLHSRYIIHRDLKMSNLLYNDRGELRVCDFGLARKVGSQHVGGGVDNADSAQSCLTPKVASLWYRPPELLFGSEYYDHGVDNWGAGCIMGELIKGKRKSPCLFSDYSLGALRDRGPSIKPGMTT